MSKTKILLTQIAGCLVLGTILGVSFWLFDGGKTCKKASEGQDVASNEQEMASVKVYQGRWHKDYLEVVR